MAELLANNFRFRRTYAKSLPAVEVDNLIQIQRASYEKFLQHDRSPHTPIGRRRVSRRVFKSVFPIQDFSQRASRSSSSATIWRRPSTTSMSAVSAG